MCSHQPPCSPADHRDRDAARTAAFHPEQGWSLLSPSRGSEAFGLDCWGIVAEPHERPGHSLDERCRSARVETRPLGGRRRDLGEHLGVDTPRVARPPGWLRICQRVHDGEAVAAQPLELVAVDDVALAA